MAKDGARADDDGSARLRDLIRSVRDTIHADQAIDEAALRLSLQEIPVLPVSDGDEIIGVLTAAHLEQAERDAKASDDTQLTARVVMTSDFAFCYLDDDAATARALMDRHGHDHLLVIDTEGALVGILGREHLPAGTGRKARRLQNRRDVVEQRENGGGVGTHVQPGGLEVYADRPKIRLRRD